MKTWNKFKNWCKDNEQKLVHYGTSVFLGGVLFLIGRETTNRIPTKRTVNKIVEIHDEVYNYGLNNSLNIHDELYGTNFKEQIQALATEEIPNPTVKLKEWNPEDLVKVKKYIRDKMRE